MSHLLMALSIKMFEFLMIELSLLFGYDVLDLKHQMATVKFMLELILHIEEDFRIISKVEPL